MKNEIITERDLGLDIIEGKETEFYSKDNNNMTIRYGARGIVEGKDGKIAVIYKKNKNEYKLPGGGVDKGEDFKEAFKRECIEEIGCIIENVEYLFDIEEDHINDNFKQISKVYISKVKEKIESNNLTEQEKEEGLEYLWLDKKEALEKMKECIKNLKGSKYDNVYRTKFVVGRDIRIMEKVMEEKKDKMDGIYMEKLTEDFSKSLFCNITDITQDYSEIGIDIFIENDLIKEIPIIKTLVNIFKIGKNIRDKNLLKQFMQELKKNNIEEEKLKKYKDEIENDRKKREEELERVLWLLNSFIDKEKSIMLSRFFKEYVRQTITWDEFCEYSEIINRLFIQDIKILREIYLKEFRDTTNRNDIYRVERLNSLGIISLSFKSLSNETINGVFKSRQDSFLELNSNGKKMMEIIM